MGDEETAKTKVERSEDTAVEPEQSICMSSSEESEGEEDEAVARESTSRSASGLKKEEVVVEKEDEEEVKEEEDMKLLKQVTLDQSSEDEKKVPGSEEEDSFEVVNPETISDHHVNVDEEDDDMHLENVVDRRAYHHPSSFEETQRVLGDSSSPESQRKRQQEREGIWDWREEVDSIGGELAPYLKEVVRTWDQYRTTPWWDTFGDLKKEVEVAYDHFKHISPHTKSPQYPGRSPGDATSVQAEKSSQRKEYGTTKKERENTVDSRKPPETKMAMRKKFGEETLKEEDEKEVQADGSEQRDRRGEEIVGYSREQWTGNREVWDKYHGTRKRKEKKLVRERREQKNEIAAEEQSGSKECVGNSLSVFGFDPPKEASEVDEDAAKKPSKLERLVTYRMPSLTSSRSSAGGQATSRKSVDTYNESPRSPYRRKSRELILEDDDDDDNDDDDNETKSEEDAPEGKDSVEKRRKRKRENDIELVSSDESSRGAGEGKKRRREPDTMRGHHVRGDGYDEDAVNVKARIELSERREKMEMQVRGECEDDNGGRDEDIGPLTASTSGLTNRRSKRNAKKRILLGRTVEESSDEAVQQAKENSLADVIRRKGKSKNQITEEDGDGEEEHEGDMEKMVGRERQGRKVDRKRKKGGDDEDWMESKGRNKRKSQPKRAGGNRKGVCEVDAIARKLKKVEEAEGGDDAIGISEVAKGKVTRRRSLQPSIVITGSSPLSHSPESPSLSPSPSPPRDSSKSIFRLRSSSSSKTYASKRSRKTETERVNSHHSAADLNDVVDEIQMSSPEVNRALKFAEDDENDDRLPDHGKRSRERKGERLSSMLYTYRFHRFLPFQD